jgi:hypothetical protein
MKCIPTDNHIRSMLDPVHPSHLQSSFDQVVATLRARGGMKDFERLGGRALIALDGTEYFCSQKLGCPLCQTRQRSNGTTDFYHSIRSREASRLGSLWLAATLVAPGHNMVAPLMPEFIARQDGAEKQDCERNAAKRWLAAHAARVKALRPVYLGDDLFACQPICEAVLASDADFLLTAKLESHKTLYDFMDGATFEEISQMRKEGARSSPVATAGFQERRCATARTPPAPGQDGKSRTRASTSSKTTAIISNIISATASRTSPCCSPP